MNVNVKVEKEASLESELSVTYVIPPSPNWYCSRICDWGYLNAHELLLAFGAKNSIYIYKCTRKNPKSVTPSYYGQIARGKNDKRVTSVLFSNDPNGKSLLLCGGEEGSVQVWDVMSLKIIEQYRKHSTEVTSLSIRPQVDSNFVIAGDQNGKISSWTKNTGKVLMFSPIPNDGVFALELSPYQDKRAVVGYRSGVVCVIDAQAGEVLFRLDGHEQEVHTVTWKPVMAPENKTDHLVATSSRDKTIKIWNLGSEELVQTFSLPKMKKETSHSQQKRLWLPIAWQPSTKPNSNVIVSGSLDGTIHVWEWDPKSKRNSNTPTLSKPGHLRSMFSIIPAPAMLTLDQSMSSLLLTVSLDREIRIWDSSTLQCLEKISGIGGHVYSVQCSPLHEGLIAAGIGDNTIRLWRTGQRWLYNDAAEYKMELLWKGLQTKVTQVAWHPIQADIIAYGTEDGKLGLYDIKTKEHKRFKSTHLAEVSRIQWKLRSMSSRDQSEEPSTSFLESIKSLELAQAKTGASIEELMGQSNIEKARRISRGIQLTLWSCCKSGKVIEHDEEKMIGKTILSAIPSNEDKTQPDKSATTTFAWSTDSFLLAIGKRNGRVDLFCENNERMDYKESLHPHLESITCLKWQSNEDSKSYFLALGSSDGRIYICSITASPNITSDVSRCLIGHLGSINDFSWKMEDETGLLLASASSDSTVQVWNVTKGIAEKNFRGHNGRVLTVEWAPKGEKAWLVSGGEDQSMRIWSPDSLQNSSPPQERLRKTKLPTDVSKLLKPVTLSILTKSLNEVDMESIQDQMKGVEDHTTVESSESKGIKKKGKKTKNILFHREKKLQIQEYLNSCRRFAFSTDQKEVESEDVDMTSLILRGDLKSLERVFQGESAKFEEEKEWEKVANIHLVTGNICEALRIVTREEALTESWLSLAPMTGVEAWREISLAYARQQEKRGDFKVAALHFLSIGKVVDGVKCLVAAGSFREALAIIRTRLSPTHPILGETLEQYADTLEKNNRFIEAARVLWSREEASSSSRIYHLLLKSGNAEALKIGMHSLSQLSQLPVGLPSAFFLEVAVEGITARDWDLVDQASKFLLDVSVKSLWLFLKVLTIFARACTGPHENASDLSASFEDSEKILKIPQSQNHPEYKKREQINALCGFMLRSSFDTTALGKLHENHYDEMRSLKFWRQIFECCDECDLFSYGEKYHEILSDKDFLMTYFPRLDQLKDDAISSYIQLGWKLSRYLSELANEYFVGAFEVLEDFLKSALSATKHEGMDKNFFVGMTALIFPQPLLDPLNYPVLGELGQEKQDAIVSWISFFFYKCHAATFIIEQKIEENTSTQTPLIADCLKEVMGCLKRVRAFRDELKDITFCDSVAQQLEELEVILQRIDQSLGF